MTTSPRRRVCQVALTAVAVAGLYLAGLRIVESQVRAHLRSAALPMEWDVVVATWTGGAVVRGLELESAAGVELTVDRARVEPNWSEALRGRARPRGVMLEGAVARADLTRAEAAGPEPGRPRSPATGRALGRLIDGFSGLQRLEVREARADVLADGEPLFEIDGEIDFERSASSPVGELSGRGSFSAPPSGVSFGAGWSAEGEWRPAEPSVEMSVDVDPAESAPSPTVDAAIGAELEAATLALDTREGRPRVRAEFRDGRVEAPRGMSAEFPWVSVEWRAGEDVRVGARGSDLVVDLSSVSSSTRSPTPAPASVGAGPDPGRSGRAFDGRLLEWLRGVDVAVEGARVRVVRGEQSREAPLATFDRVEAVLDERTFELAARAAGGRIRVSVRRRVGSWMPAAAMLEARSLKLEAAPGVGADEPAIERGARARIGGRFDASAAVLPRRGAATLGAGADGAFDLRWREGWVESDALAERRATGIDLSLQSDFALSPELARMRLASGRFEYGPIAGDLRATFTDWRRDPRLELALETAAFDCQRAVRALPDALLGPYRQIELEGRASPQFRLDFAVERPEELSIDLDRFPRGCRVTGLNARENGWPSIEVAGAAGGERGPGAGGGDGDDCGRGNCCAGERCPPAPRDWSSAEPEDVFWLRTPFVLEMAVDAAGEETVRVGPGLESFVPLDGLPDYVGGAAYLSEEIGFYDGGAWNVGLIQRALRMNFDEHRFVYGGSTVTQQLVKNLFLTRRKTLARKAREALIAWRIQRVVPKDRVLELYLNCIQFGRDVYGIGPAARHYFDKPALALTLKQALFLAAIKPAPWYGDRFMERGSTPERGWWPDRMREIAGRLVDEGIVTRQRVERAEPFVLTWEGAGSGSGEP